MKTNFISMYVLPFCVHSLCLCRDLLSQSRDWTLPQYPFFMLAQFGQFFFYFWEVGCLIRRPTILRILGDDELSGSWACHVWPWIWFGGK